MTVYRSSKGDACIVCDGKYPFASKEAMGIYLDIERTKFMCWECVHAVSKKLQAHINSHSYNLLFLTEADKEERGMQTET